MRARRRIRTRPTPPRAAARLQRDAQGDRQVEAADSFGKSAGARLTVTLRAGNSNCAFCSAARTRSRLSLTSVSGNPTRLNAGSPPARCTSTATGGASNPESARLCRTATGINQPRSSIARRAAAVPPPRYLARGRAWRVSSSATRASSASSFSRVRNRTCA